MIVLKENEGLKDMTQKYQKENQALSEINKNIHKKYSINVQKFEQKEIQQLEFFQKEERQKQTMKRLEIEISSLKKQNSELVERSESLSKELHFLKGQLESQEKLLKGKPCSESLQVKENELKDLQKKYKKLEDDLIQVSLIEVAMERP